MTEVTLHVDPSNTDQLRQWDGDGGEYWAENADFFDRSLAGHHLAFMRGAALRPADRVLDIGCGSGETTRDAARAAASGSALGVDLSSPLLALARRRAAEQGLENARFEQADAQIHPFETAAFDVAISRTGSMFFGDAPAAFMNIARALRTGGRLVLCSWRDVPDNPWFTELAGALAVGRDLPAPQAGAPGPFAHADRDVVTALLEGAGFTDVTFESSTAPMWWGADVDQAEGHVLAIMGWLLADVDDETRVRALTALRASLAAHAGADGVVYPSATWLIAARRN